MSRATSELAHLFRALKAPAAARALPKLADRARAEEWSFERFAEALLKTEIDSRDSHGGRARIKQARFPRARRSRTSTSPSRPASAATPCSGEVVAWTPSALTVRPLGLTCLGDPPRWPRP